jgi:diguanylate cyclase (GGDEF)-like protein/PAS domain S-box-containing protein
MFALWRHRELLSQYQRSSTEDQLLAAEAKYRTLVEQIPLVTYVDALTESATSLYASPQVESLLGYSVDEWLSDPEFFPKLLHPDDRERILALVAHCNETAEPFEAEYRLITRDGRTVWVQDESLVVQDADGRKLFTQGYLLDITARKESEQRLAAAHAVARVTSEAETTGEAAPQIVKVVCEALAWESGAIWLVDPEHGELTCVASRGEVDADVAELAREHGTPVSKPQPESSPGDGTYAVPVRSGAEVLGVLAFRGRGICEPDTEVAGTLGAIASQLAQFIERKHGEEALRHQALHDGLTGLPNRALFNDRVQHAIEQSRRHDQPFALLIMDLDCFKDVNDTLGHHFGDRLLHDLGTRLRECVRSSETVARLGGDEFGFLLTGVDPRETATLVERVQGVLSEPFTVHGMPLEIEASIGVAFFPEHGASVDELLQHADVAMYVAKRTGARSAVYDADEDSNTRTRLTIGGELRRALEHRELALFYQPQVELATGTVTGVEAMLGWQHPTHGLLAPEALRPIAERAGLIDGLTRYVVEGAVRQRAQWQREGYRWPVAVNVSTRSFDREQFAGDLEKLLGRWNVPASALKLELTEPPSVTDSGRAAEALEMLRRLGVRVTLDHVGGAQSSIASLRLLPVDEIKLDAPLVAGVESSPDDLAIVASVIDLSRRLGLEVVADGVDTPEFCAVLGDLGCHSGQGRHWTAPLPPDLLTSWLAKRGAASGTENQAA